MTRRKAAAFVLALVFLSSAVVSYYLFFQSAPTNGSSDEPEITPHPYNALNWWDIAWDLGVHIDYYRAISDITSHGWKYLEPTTEPGDSGYFEAADFIIDRLGGWGINIDYVGENYAVLGHQQGYGTDNRAIVFGAHLDASDWYGFNQNAAGCAIVYTIANILSQYRLPIDIYYGFFSYNMYFINQEQRALWGSQDVAAYLADNNVEVMAMYNFDEVLYRDPTQQENDRLLVEHNIESTHGYHKTRYLADLLVSFMSKSGLDVIRPNEHIHTQTDHISFWARGMPAVNVKSGHSIGDFPPFEDSYSFQNFNHSQALWLAKSAASVAVYLSSQGNGEQTVYKLERKLSSGQSASVTTILTTSTDLAFTGMTNSSVSVSVQASNGVVLEPTLVSGSVIDVSTQSAEIGETTLFVVNNGEDTAYIDLYIRYDADTDGDGTLDSEQYNWDDPDPPLDWDGDGLYDYLETEVGTDIFIQDTDLDSVIDGTEYELDMDPLRDDTEEDLDGDTLTNIQEITIGTHPNRTDSEGDGLPDNWEVSFRTNPLVNDSMEDPDNDNLTNIEEFLNGADPLSEDGDFDGIPDADEVALGTDPLNEDSDNDGIRDQLELIEGLNPLVPDYDSDMIPDGPDHNPRVNVLIVIVVLTLIPVGIGSFVFWRRIRQ